MRTTNQQVWGSYAPFGLFPALFQHKTLLRRCFKHHGRHIDVETTLCANWVPHVIL